MISTQFSLLDDSIHVVLGGGGHFGDPAGASVSSSYCVEIEIESVGGFDPMFFFHHAQVDRLFALWSIVIS